MSTETKPPYSPGLAGVVAGETEICWVDPNAGLMYRGYDIHEMANKASFEEVAYLLLNGELPNGGQLANFTNQLASERALPDAVIKMMRLMPKNTHPMDMLRTGVSMLGPFDPDLNDHSHAANVRKAMRLIARVSSLITDGWRISQGQDPIPDKPDLTHAGNFFYKLTGGVPQDWQIRMLDTIYILYADHEFNASTFAARVTASTLSDMYSAVTSACGTLKGPLHGGANEESMKMLDDIKTPDRAEGWLKAAAREEGEDHGLRSSRLQGGRFAECRSCGRSRAISAKRLGKEQWVPICENLETDDGARETLVRQCRSLRRAGVHDAEIPAGIEYADLRRLAGRGMVRARRRAARS